MGKNAEKEYSKERMGNMRRGTAPKTVVAPKKYSILSQKRTFGGRVNRQRTVPTTREYLNYMDRYVHVTDESMSAAIRQFEAAG